MSIQTIFSGYHLVFTNRCNDAIKQALDIAKRRGFTSVGIQDEGGWFLYEKFAKQRGFDVYEIPTNEGKLARDSIRPNTVVLSHTLCGYAILDDAQLIRQHCDAHGCLYIEDVCGCPQVSHFGHMVVCSFGRAKPLSIGHGGVLACEQKDWCEGADSSVVDMEALTYSVVQLPEKLIRAQTLIAKMKKDLSSYELRADSHALVLIVFFETDAQKEKIISYCQTHSYPFELCPRYIRTNKPAVSIEVKRLL
ncbi:MAG: hypothetical protein ACMXYF_05725 [Candidatus Woesearchaeota archaeon]